MLSDEQWEFLQDIARLIIEAKSFGYKLTGGELWRTKYQQEQYVKFKKSLTMNSLHLSRMAIDFNIWIKNENNDWELTENKNKIKPLGEFWESLDPKNRWGGNFNNFKDLGHFEKRI